MAASGAAWGLAGMAAVAAGVLAPSVIHAQLPQVVAGPDAVGGALVALGATAGALGVAHLATAVAMRGGAQAGPALGVVLSATMAVLLLASGIAAFVSLGTASAPAGLLLAVGIGLTAWAAGYAWAAVGLVRARAGGPT